MAMGRTAASLIPAAVAALLAGGGCQARPSPSTGLVGHWRFDEGRDTLVGDSSGHGNRCAVEDGARWAGTGAPLPEGSNPSSLAFDGHGYVQCPSPSGMRFENPYSVSLWFRTENHSDVNLAVLYTMKTESGIGIGFRNKQLQAWTWGGGTMVITGAPRAGWHHLAHAYDGTHVTLYLDGVAVAMSTAPTHKGPIEELSIGGSRPWKGSITGQIDDVRLYDRALDASEVRALYQGPPQRALYIVGTIAAVLLVLLIGQRVRLYRDRARFALVLGERNRIARDLHDSLAQGFTGLNCQVELLAQDLRDKPERAAETLAQARGIIGHMRLEARQLIWNLRSQAATSLDVRAALEESARTAEVLGNALVRVESRGQERALSEDVTQSLLRIAQEAMTNAVAHGQAHHIDVTLSFEAGAVLLKVADDGRGFDLTNGTAKEPHFGIVGMRERVERLSGRLAIASAPGQGTSIDVWIPTGPAALPPLPAAGDA